MLRKHIGEKVKGIHLGGSQLVRDPVSRTFDKKPTKAFMVSQTTLILERGQLRIPHKDVDEMIHRQMTNYQVERVSPKTGEPTYSNDDEHALDAMMLALLAFINEKPELAETVEKITNAKTILNIKTKMYNPLLDVTGFSAPGMKQKEEWDEPSAPPPKKVAVGSKRRNTGLSWGSRGTQTAFKGRTHF